MVLPFLREERHSCHGAKTAGGSGPASCAVSHFPRLVDQASSVRRSALTRQSPAAAAVWPLRVFPSGTARSAAFAFSLTAQSRRHVAGRVTTSILLCTSASLRLGALMALVHGRTSGGSYRLISRPRSLRITARTKLAKYGLTVDDYDRMLAEQGGVCKLCGQPPNPEGIRASSKLHADHDHESGVVRDLLCTTCNRGLGYFKDDPVLLRAAAEYIERHRSLP